MRPRKGLTVAQQLQAPLNQALLNRAYRAYGEAMESAQLLETSLALLLLGVFYERSDLENLEECAKLHGYLFKATVGRLILRLKRELPSTAIVERQLNKALQLRNLLAHDYFRTYMFEWLYPAGLRRRVRHLRRINHHLQHVTNIVSHIWDLLCKKGKVDAEITIQEINVKLLPRIKELKEL